MKNEEIVTSYGRVSNVNRTKLKNMKKGKLYKIGLCVGVISVLTVGTLVSLIAKYIDRNKINEIPKDQTVTTISVDVKYGDTFYDIADRFYTSDCEGVYRYIDNYVKAIQEENNNYGTHIEQGNVLEVPVIIDKDNPYYLQILEIQNKIVEIEKNDLWIRHTVKPGESLSELAQLSSGSISETYENLKNIYSKNGMSAKTNLRDGDVVWIMNPELGQLKLQLEDLEQQLEQSLIVNQQKK